MRLFGCAAAAALVFVLLQPAAARSPGISLTLTEPELGEWLFIWGASVEVSVAPGEELTFSWDAEYEIPYGATIIGYRYGWDLSHFQYDADDPGWAIPDLAQVTSAPPRSFSTGAHNFVAYVEDDLGRSTIAVVLITVDPALPSGEISVSRLKSRTQ